MPAFEDKAETEALEARKSKSPARQDGHSCQSGHREDPEVTADIEARKQRTGDSWGSRVQATKGAPLQR